MLMHSLRGETVARLLAAGWLLLAAAAGRAGDDDLVFIHHSCGRNWLNNSLHTALLAKAYIDERNDIYYGTDIQPDSGRPDSLGGTPGDHTDMCHWIRWFNDYLEHVILHDCADGTNRIIMFKSCYPNSNIASDGTEPGDPFSSQRTLANYRAVYRHPDGPGGVYTNDGYIYHPLEDIFASHPDILFIPVTAPPRHYAPSDATTDAEGHRARTFNNWLKNEWLAAYNSNHPGFHNVAVFDWFDVLAYPDSDPDHPNRLRAEYGGESGDSHPNSAANATSTWFFASGPTNFLDQAWESFHNQDTDTDGLPDWWEREHCGNLTNMSAHSDQDSDHFSDLEEYRAGTDPLDPASLLRLTGIVARISRGECILHWLSVTGRTYTVSRTFSLASPDFLPAASNLPPTPPVNTWTDHISGTDRAFYRISTSP